MPWDKDTITRLIEVEAQLQGVDPRLALAVAQQESGLDPHNPGDNGASRGVFHLQRKAAIDAGIDPKQRDDPAIGIFAGVKYLKQQLDKSGGHIPSALSRYNRGTPEYRGIGDPDYVYHVMRHYPDHPLGQAPADQEAYRARLNKTFGKGTAPEEPRQQPGLVARVGQALSPASAEAATPQAPGRSRLEEIEAELVRRDGQQAPGSTQTPPDAPAPPTARSTPEQDAAYRASRGQQEPPPVSQTAPAPQTSPGASQVAPEEPITPEARFLRLPAIQQLPLEERTQRFTDFYGLRPNLKEEFLRSEEPPSDLTVDIEKASAPAVPRDPEARAAQIRAELAAWEQQQGRPWREGDPLMPTQRAAIAGATSEAPLEEGITKPSTMIPLLMPGAGLKATAPLLKQAAPLVQRAVRPVAEGLSQTLGWGTGRTVETGQVPSAGELGREAAIATAFGGALETLSAGTRAVLRRSRAGKAIAAADEATAAAQQQWREEAQAAQQARQQGQADLYDRALEKATQAQREYQAARLRRDDIIAANQQEYDFAVRSQGEALQQARQVPGRYAPETPSWVMYEKFGDAAKDATVDLAPAKAALGEARASRGVLPDGSARPFPQAVESIAANLEKAGGTVNVQTIRDELRRLGPLTRHADGNIRGPAKQLYGIYADALEASPVANDLLRQANATFRKEMALQDVQEWLRPGHGVVRIDNQGRQTINVGALMTRLEKHIGDDTFFAKSFTPDELQALRTDVGRLAGTPAMPRQPPRSPSAVTPPDQELLPGGAGTMRRPPDTPPAPGATSPTVTRPRIFPRGQEWAQQAGKWGGLLYVLDQIGVSPKTVAALKLATVTQQQGSWLLAKALLTPRLRPLLEAGMAGGGQMHPGTYKAVMAALSARERKQMERETAADQRTVRLPQSP